jgi:hypothetical protein
MSDRINCSRILTKKVKKNSFFQKSNIPANNILALKHCSAYIKKSFSECNAAFQLRI